MMMVKNGADKPITYKASDVLISKFFHPDYATALHVACGKNRQDIVEILLQYGADPHPIGFHPRVGNGYPCELATDNGLLKYLDKIHTEKYGSGIRRG